MSNLTQLRLAAREIFNATLQGADSYEGVRGAIALNGSKLQICDVTIDLTDHQKIYSIAIGKAALPMAAALEYVLGYRLTAGIISTSSRYNARRASEPATRSQVSNSRHTVFDGGHPEPNEQSLAAAQACFDLLKRADEARALVIFLISGGGSAMLEWPISEDISLNDLRATNKVLVNSGASISEINAVRRAFSGVKGGRLAARATNCDQITLIVSDVPAGQGYNVASGPTLSPPSDVALSAREIVAGYELRSKLPESVLRAVYSEQPLRKVESDGSSYLRKHLVLLDNTSAVAAAAQAARDRNFYVEIATDISDQSIEKGCAQLMTRLLQIQQGAQQSSATCLISGGEFSCPVRGQGIGGRNLESALRLACSSNLSLSDSENFVALCAGTDGIDGNSPAAGAIVDNTTISRARAIGLDPEGFLSRSDSYSFFVALGDVITTGPTGTNVRDLRILLTTLTQ